MNIDVSPEKFIRKVGIVNVFSSLIIGGAVAGFAGKIFFYSFHALSNDIPSRITSPMGRTK